MTEAHDGGLARLNAIAIEQGVPLFAYLELTHRCRCDCVFCCNPRARREEELDIHDWKRVLSELRKLGTLYVTLTGGDPLLHHGFLDVASESRRLGMALRVFTNGDLIDDRMADRLAGLPCLSVELSIHGASRQSHDKTTRWRGSFRRLWRAVELLQARNVPTVLKCPVSKLNENDLPSITALAEAKEVPLRLDPAIVAGDDGTRDSLRWRATTAGVRRTMEVLACHDQLPVAEYGPGQPVCGVGASTLAVDPEGRVFPCIQWRHESLGNVRSATLQQLWESSPLRSRIASVARRAGAMLAERNDALSRYPFCPAVAVREHHDPLAVGPYLRRQAEAADELRSVG